jgi:putative aldouronate transport system substrate-binding protein
MMKRSKIKLLAAIAAVSILGSVFAGCAAKKPSSGGTGATTGTATTGEVTYPIKSDATLKYWVQLNGNVADIHKSMNETEYAKTLQEKTGIKVEFLHPAAGQEKEQFNLLVASGELPDLVEWIWPSFPGGPEKAIKDGSILKLNDTIDKFAPNLKKYLSANKDVEKMMKTDSGSIYSFPFVRGDDLLLVFYGPILRNDWLKELNLEAPTTVEEWEKVLRAFKEKKGAEAPLTIDARTGLPADFICGAFGVNTGYFMSNGKVKYGPLEPGYKEYIEKMHQWYKEGLLDKNFATIDGKAVQANMLNGKSGATLGYNGGSLGTWMKAMEGKPFDLGAAPFPTKNKGETPVFTQKDWKVPGTGVAISAKSKNVELAARLLDYGYSKEGELLYNFGKEGVSYKMEGTYPKFTTEVTNNPNKLSIGQAIAKYARSAYQGPFVQRKEYIEQYLTLPQQQAAIKTWSKNDAYKTMVPPITPTPEESSKLSKIDSDISTYVSEMQIKFVMGSEPLSNYDKFVDQIKKLNVEEAIKIRDAAVERYNKR